MLKKGTPVRVTWNDIQDYADDDWNGDVDAVVSATMHTYGIVAEDCKKSHRDLRLARDESEDEDTLHGLRAIPTGCIVSVQLQEPSAELWDKSRSPDDEDR